MRVLVLGGGVIGVSSAWYLARAGHEVVVVDRQPAVAQETSFANAGQISPGYASPWAAPGVPLKAIKWLLMHHSPLVIKPMLDPAMWRWGLSMLRNCTEARYQVNKGRMVRLAEYSRDCMRALRRDTGIAYEGRQQGTVQLFRTRQQFDGAMIAQSSPLPTTARRGPTPAGRQKKVSMRSNSPRLMGGIVAPSDALFEGIAEIHTPHRSGVPRIRGLGRALAATPHKARS